MKGKRKKYTNEFKDSAVQLVLTGGKAAAQVATFTWSRIKQVIRFAGIAVVAWLLCNSFFLQEQFTFPVSGASWQKSQFVRKHSTEIRLFHRSRNRTGENRTNYFPPFSRCCSVSVWRFDADRLPLTVTSECTFQ